VKKPTLAIFYNNFTKFDYEKFRIKKIKKNYNVKYFNLSLLLNLKEKNSKKLNYKDYIYINSIFDLYKYLKSHKNIYILDLLGVSFKPKLSLIRILISHFAIGILPVIGLRYRISNIYISQEFKKNFEKIFNFISKLLFKNFIFRNYYLILSGKYKENFYKGLSKNKPFFTYSADYQKYLDIKKNYKPKKKYAVFLEENLVDHPDYYHSAQGFPPIREKDYYKWMNFFFLKFKSKFNCNIIISAHPKSPINKIKKNFAKYKVFQGNTQNLIKNSSYVIGHASTAISYAVLFNKKIFFANFYKIKYDFVGREIDMTSKLLDSNTLYLDKNFNLEKNEKKINKFAYKSYVTNFLKHQKCKNYSLDKIFKYKLKNLYNN
jgi:hypothetical protein